MSSNIEELVERVRYTAAILDANAGKFAVPDHIPAKTRSLRDAADEIERLHTRVEAMTEALEEIAHPMVALQRMAEAEGAELNHMANQIAYDGYRLARIAEQALSTCRKTDGGDGAA